MSLADPPETRLALEGLLEWYLDMGVDAAIGEAPHDRFATVAPASPPVAREVPTKPAPAAFEPSVRKLDTTAVPAEALIAQATQIAASATTLDELRDLWATVPGCNLAATATRMIFAGGTAGARLMLIGAAPEAEDERQGEAFAGAQGRLLDAMLRAIGLSRADVYLSNVIPWRPPGGRAPNALELAVCLPFARRQVALAAPRLLLCLGERAAQPLLDTRDPVSRLRGRWLTFEGDGTTVKTLVTFSPDYLLKQPLQKRRAWADLQMVGAEMAV